MDGEASIFFKRNLTLDFFAIILGILGGVAGFAFRKSVELLDGILFGGEGKISVVSLWDQLIMGLGLGWLVIVLLPAIGGLIVGPFIYKVAPEAKGHGIPNVLAAIYLQDGKMRARVPIAKYALSVISIGTGASVGAEGPIGQIGAGIGSIIGQKLNLRPIELNILITTGVSAGIASVFNAPLGGVLFGLEIVLASIAVYSVIPVVIGAVTAVTVNFVLLGKLAPVFQVPTYSIHSPVELIFFLVLGILCGFLGIVWQRSLYFSEELFDEKMTKLPPALKPALGGIIVGLILLLNFNLANFITLNGLDLRGSGYKVIQETLRGFNEEALTKDVIPMVILLLLLLCILKIVITSVSIGSGASGGIFSPSLFMGATLGAAYGFFIKSIFPQIQTSVGLYAVIGMAAMFAGVARAPLTMIIMTTEMSGDFFIFPALMVACASSFLIHHYFVTETIYTEKLASQGISVVSRPADEVMNYLLVKDVMHHDVVAILKDTPVRDFMDIFVHYRHGGYPVVDDDGTLLGIFCFSDFRYAVVSGKLDVPIIELATKKVVTAEPHWTIKKAIDVMYRYGIGRLPVCVEDESGKKKIIGIFTRSDLVKAIETFKFILTKEHHRHLLAIQEKLEKPIIELLPSKYPNLKGKVVNISLDWWSQAQAQIDKKNALKAGQLEQEEN